MLLELKKIINTHFGNRYFSLACPRRIGPQSNKVFKPAGESINSLEEAQALRDCRQDFGRPIS